MSLESAVPTTASLARRSATPVALSPSTHLLSRSLWRAAEQTCTWNAAPLKTKAEATQAESGRELGLSQWQLLLRWAAAGEGCWRTPGRGRPGISRPGAAPAPNETR